MSNRDDHRAERHEATIAGLEARNRSLKLRLQLALGALALGVAGAIVWVVVRGDSVLPSSGSGQLRATGPTLGGAWTFEVGRCVSGQHVQFYGVDIVAKDDPTKVMRLIEDPIRGSIVRLNVVGKNAARFIERSECTSFDVELRPTGPLVDGIRALDGHVALACKFADGGTLDGRLEFTRCN